MQALSSREYKKRFPLDHTFLPFVVSQKIHTFPFKVAKSMFFPFYREKKFLKTASLGAKIFSKFFFLWTFLKGEEVQGGKKGGCKEVPIRRVPIWRVPIWRVPLIRLCYFENASQLSWRQYFRSLSKKNYTQETNSIALQSNPKSYACSKRLFAYPTGRVVPNFSDGRVLPRCGTCHIYIFRGIRTINQCD